VVHAQLHAVEFLDQEIVHEQFAPRTNVQGLRSGAEEGAGSQEQVDGKGFPLHVISIIHVKNKGTLH
jgi:hypothetical protein